MDFEPVIGLEVHAQLLTRSKMFCACSASYQDASPNTHVCPVCLGMPGTLPVINRQAIESTIMTGLALNCRINPQSKFDRKNYPYPDLMKGYQISQYDQPLCSMGWLMIAQGEGFKKAGITRVHLEEDTAKLSHRTGAEGSYSLVDVNRSGVPLMEIVGEPDLRSAEEASAYLIKLRQILQYLGVSSGNLEEGNFRCDANISLRPRGTTEFGTRAEVKNMNSFRAVRRALEYEIKRQAMVLESGGRIVQETRGWVEARGETVSQRSKEQAHDYRYFPEPDLPPMAIDPAWVEELRGRLPELPDARVDRFMREYGLPGSDAITLTATTGMSRFFEAAVAAGTSPNPARDGGNGEGGQEWARNVANWCRGDFSRLLNLKGLEPDEARLTPDALAELVGLVMAGQISAASGKEVLEEMLEPGGRAQEIVQAKGLRQISGSDELADVVEQILQENPTAVADYQKGKEQAIGFLVGQVMKQTRGRANHGTVTALLREKLGAIPSGQTA